MAKPKGKKRLLTKKQQKKEGKKEKRKIKQATVKATPTETKAAKTGIKEPKLPVSTEIPDTAEKETSLPIEDARRGKASVRNEKTRDRVQARTGLTGPGQNKAFKYTADATADEVETAMDEGKNWVRERWRALGLPVHELPF